MLANAPFQVDQDIQTAQRKLYASVAVLLADTTTMPPAMPPARLLPLALPGPSRLAPACRYRSILKLHRDKLPGPMRAMGDKYVKTEFLAHLKGKTTEEQWHQFVTEWTKYRTALGGEANVDEQPQDVLSQMNPEQQSKMSGLYDEAKKLRSSMIDDALNIPRK